MPAAAATPNTELRPIEYFSSNFFWWHRRLACAAQAKACGYKNNHLNATRYKGELRPGDIILFAGKRCSARLVNWFQSWFAKDGLSEYNHAAVVTSAEGQIFESVRWWPRVIGLRRRYRRSQVMIVRWQGMTLERFHRGMAEVAYLKDRVYPIWRQLLHALRLAGFFRGVDAVCSELVAKFLYGAGARHKRWAGVNVADLHDEFVSQPDRFEVVFRGRLKDFF